jgi:hypothetical protein
MTVTLAKSLSLTVQLRRSGLENGSSTLALPPDQRIIHVRAAPRSSTGSFPHPAGHRLVSTGNLLVSVGVSVHTGRGRRQARRFLASISITDRRRAFRMSARASAIKFRRQPRCSRFSGRNAVLRSRAQSQCCVRRPTSSLIPGEPNPLQKRVEAGGLSASRRPPCWHASRFFRSTGWPLAGGEFHALDDFVILRCSGCSASCRATPCTDSSILLVTRHRRSADSGYPGRAWCESCENGPPRRGGPRSGPWHRFRRMISVKSDGPRDSRRRERQEIRRGSGVSARDGTRLRTPLSVSC